MRTLLIDDHPLFRQGLKFLLSDLDKQIEFLEAECCAQALEIADEHEIELILLDLHMPGLDGVDALTTLRERVESAVVVVLSSEDDPNVIHQVIELGASGFIPKASTPEILIAALRLVLAGGVYLPPNAFYAGRKRTASGQDDRSQQLQGLSARQLEVLLKAVQGKPNKVIAREIDIAPSTVKQHLSAAFRALGVHNRTEAVFAAAELGLTQSNQAT